MLLFFLLSFQITIIINIIIIISIFFFFSCYYFWLFLWYPGLHNVTLRLLPIIPRHKGVLIAELVSAMTG
jgi:hypothetical protein